MKLTSTTASSAILVMALVGCEGSTRSGPVDPRPSSSDASMQQVPAEGIKSQQTYVTCRATLSAYEESHHWFDDSSAGHDDGTAPLATFLLLEPEEHAGRAVGILFKYTPEDSTPAPPTEADIGRQFTFEVPDDFLSGASSSIDNTTVRHLRPRDP